MIEDNIIYLKVKKILKLFINIIIIIVLLLFSRCQLNKDDPYVSDVFNNLNSFPIFDIYLPNIYYNNSTNEVEEKCNKHNSSNVIEELLLDYTWQGIPYGCDCNNSLVGKGYISNGFCSLFELLNYCEVIHDTSPFKAKYWKGKSLCIARKHFSFKKYLFYFNTNSTLLENNNCCGFDTLNNILCLEDNDLQCPINHIYLLHNSTTNVTEQSISLNNDWNLYYSNIKLNSSSIHNRTDELEHNLLINLKYSEGRICINPDEPNIKYILHDQDKEIYCKSYINGLNRDLRYIKLDSYSKMSFFKDNFIYNKLNDLVDTKKIKEQNSFLYYRTLIYWDNNNCLYSINEIYSNLVTILKIRDYINIVIMLLIVYLIFHLISLKVSIIKNYHFESFSLFLLGMMMSLIVYEFYKNIDFFAFLENFNCSDNDTNILFNNVGSNYITQFSDIGVICILTMLMIII